MSDAPYLQALLQEQRGEFSRRLHLRFREGDDSYNYLVAGQIFIGVFDAATGERAKAMLTRHFERVASTLEVCTLAEAALRVEDSTAFVETVMKTGRAPRTFETTSTYALSVALGNVDGETSKQVFALNASDELPQAVAELLSDAFTLGDSLADAAREKTNR